MCNNGAQSSMHLDLCISPHLPRNISQILRGCGPGLKLLAASCLVLACVGCRLTCRCSGARLRKALILHAAREWPGCPVHLSRPTALSSLWLDRNLGHSVSWGIGMELPAHYGFYGVALLPYPRTYRTLLVSLPSNYNSVLISPLFTPVPGLKR